MQTQSSPKTAIIITICLLAGLGIGFFAGMEYKAYQIRQAIGSIEDVFTDQNSPTSDTQTTSDSFLTQKNTQDVEKVIGKTTGEDVALATLTIRVDGATETQTLSKSYSTPVVAKAGRKFAVLDVSITNTTNDAFSFYPEGFKLVDNSDRAFNPFDDVYGTENIMNGRDLAPSLTEEGTMIFEIPDDVDSYSLTVGKAGTNELYKVKVK